MRAVLLVSFLCGVMTAACMPTSDELMCTSAPEEGHPAPVRRLFDCDVRPLLETKCAQCHADPNNKYGAPQFLGVDPRELYTALVSRTDFVACDVQNSLLLNEGLDPTHPGGALSAPQHTRVERWLTEEALERFGGVCKHSPPPAGTGQSDAGAPPAANTGLQALQQFGDCMTLEDWRDANMPLVALQQADNGGQKAPCFSCHATGPGGNWMPDPGGPDASVGDAFEKMRRVYSVFHLVRWTVHDEDGSFKDIVQSYRWRDKGTSADHPIYALEPAYQAYVDDWFARTYDRWKSGSCKP